MRHLTLHIKSRAAVLALLILAAGGCGPKARTEPIAKLEGTVTINGKPLADNVQASVVFRGQVAGQAPPVQTSIKGGHYKAEKVPIGKVSANFSIMQPTGKILKTSPDDEHPSPELINQVPEKLRGGIMIEVKGDNARQDFDLK